MDNEIRIKIPDPEPEEEQPQPEEAKSKRPSKILKATDYSFFMDGRSLRRLYPMFFFLAALGMFYIYNAHYAQRIVRRTDKMKGEIKELRAEYITIKSKLMHDSKQSQVVNRLAESELKELRNPPFKITYTEKDER